MIDHSKLPSFISYLNRIAILILDFQNVSICDLAEEGGFNKDRRSRGYASRDDGRRFDDRHRASWEPRRLFVSFESLKRT